MLSKRFLVSTPRRPESLFQNVFASSLLLLLLLLFGFGFGFLMKQGPVGLHEWYYKAVHGHALFTTDKRR